MIESEPKSLKRIPKYFFRHYLDAFLLLLALNCAGPIILEEYYNLDGSSLVVMASCWVFSAILYILIFVHRKRQLKIVRDVFKRMGGHLE